MPQSDFPIPPSCSALVTGLNKGVVANDIFYLADPAGFPSGIFNATNTPLDLPVEPYVMRTPYEEWEIETISCPVIVVAHNGATPALNATLTLRLFLNGRLAWNSLAPFPLVQDGATNDTASYDVVQTDFVNGIRIVDSKCLRFGFSISFDQSVVGFQLMIGVALTQFVPVRGLVSPGQMSYNQL